MGCSKRGKMFLKSKSFQSSLLLVQGSIHMKAKRRSHKLSSFEKQMQKMYKAYPFPLKCTYTHEPSWFKWSLPGSSLNAIINIIEHSQKHFFLGQINCICLLGMYYKLCNIEDNYRNLTSYSTQFKFVRMISQL